MNNNLVHQHHCDALVIHCIDFRFHEAIRDFLHNELNIESYDLLTIPGAAKHLTATGSATRREGLLEDISISIRLHAPKEIILINHADCGAYGGAKAFENFDDETKNHESALRESRAVLHDKFSGLRVKICYAEITDQGIKTQEIS